ncbi:MAG: glycosyltransferase family 4 protein [Hyphomicrobiales bacterium]|nr:glycosyltransferase family 4 protein [Hyphomicrobiales bacterium]
MMGKKLKIAYLCDQPPWERWSYSGGNKAIFEALMEHVGDVTVLDREWGAIDFIRRFISFTPEAINLRAGWRAHLLLSKYIARNVQRQLTNQDFDVLFCPYSFHSLHNVTTPGHLLTVYTSDATPTIYKNSAVGSHFGSYLAISRYFDPLILNAERKVFRSNDLNLWPSEWLKNRADELYGLEDTRSLHIPWGANVIPPDRHRLIFNMPLDGQLRLLLIGRDWVAKGGPLVAKVLDHLAGLGIDVHMTVVGCVPPDEHRRERMTVYEYLDKTIPGEREIFERLLLESHFLIMPSFESYGFAFAEASAHGLPSLALRVGGVPIREGVNGHALPVAATEEDFVEKILSYSQDEERYFRLRESSRQQFDDELNWGAWGRKVSAVIHDRLGDEIPVSASKTTSMLPPRSAPAARRSAQINFRANKS